MTLEKNRPGRIEDQPGDGAAYGPMGVMTKWVEVTPELAYEWLANQAPNRGLSKAHAQPMIDDMVGGRWLPIPGGIAFNADDEMINGQHTCYSIFEADLPMWVQVTWNLPDGAQDVMDANRKRNLRDQMTIWGENNTTQRAAAIRLLCSVETGWERGWSFKGLAAKKLSISEYKQRYYDDLAQGVSVDQALSIAEKVHHGAGMPPSAGGALYMLIARHGYSAEAAERFMQSVANGYGLYPGYPEEALRKRVKKLNEDQRKPHNTYYLAHAIKAYNAWARDDEMYRCEFRSGIIMPKVYPGLKRRPESQFG